MGTIALFGQERSRITIGHVFRIGNEQLPILVDSG
jgi:hypothetical protein